MTGFVKGFDDVWRIEKTPDSVLDYAHNWTTWLDGDTINTSIWTVQTGLVKENESVVSGNKTLIWLSGGTADVTYVVTNSITTDLGRISSRVFYVVVVEELSG